MELKDSPAEAQFRAQARAWLQDTWPRLGGPEPARLEDKLDYSRTWQRLLYDAGYAGLSWPKEYGGGGADAKLRAVFNEELDRAGAPERLNIIGEDFAGPTIIEFGTPAQQERYLRPILTGEEIWCQLFSEPEAGSDLASLRTTATKVPGGWRIQGQKIWTSRAQLAAHAILLARTGGGPRHHGITYFLLAMDTPGVEVRPLAHMLGMPYFPITPTWPLLGPLGLLPLPSKWRITFHPPVSVDVVEDGAPEPARVMELADSIRTTIQAGVVEDLMRRQRVFRG